MWKCVLIVMVFGLLAGTGWSQSDDKAANETCPVSGTATDGKTFSKVAGRNIGFCCEKCKAGFALWDDTKKNEYLTSLKSADSRQATKAPEKVSDPYPFGQCLVSDQPLNAMGKPVSKKLEGREVKFCCARCAEKFEASKEKYLAKLDAKIIEDQKPVYPTDECLLMPKSLMRDGKDVGKDYVIGNRLVRLCCKRCGRSAMGNPGRILMSLDKAVIEKQGADYPLDTCLVSGEKLDSKSGPVDVVVANRLLRLCCQGCEGEVMKNPSVHVAKVDKARKLKAPKKPKGKEVEKAGK